MRITRTSLLLAMRMVYHAAAVPCANIGFGYVGGLNGPKVSQLDPFTAGQGFDIISSQDCFIRFQPLNKNPNYRPGPMSPSDFANLLKTSRVTTSEWTATPESVAATGDDPYNTEGANDALWLSRSEEAYQYAGLLKRGFQSDAQPGLRNADTIVTYFKTVGPQGFSTNANILASIGIVGLSGTVDPNVDYAYAPMFRVALGLAARYPDPKNSHLFGYSSEDGSANDPRYASVFGRFVTADLGNGDCVIIDFRDMPAYMTQTNNYENVEVCSADVPITASWPSWG